MRSPDTARTAATRAGAGRPRGRAHGGQLPPVAHADPIERALSEVLKLDAPADATLRAFFRTHPGLGRRDRARVAETVFDVLRNRRLYEHFAASGFGPHVRRLRWLSRSLRFHEPPPADDADLVQWIESIRGVDQTTLAAPVRWSMPDWLWQALEAQLPAESLPALAEALLQPAPLDLRVNTLKTTRDAALAALSEAGVRAMPLAWPPDAVRVAGKPALETMPAFVEGWLEVQDAGSQLLAQLVAPRRGHTVVDFCAGAGGKTLALAALLRGSGQVFALDVSVGRLIKLRPRLARSGATNVQPMGIDSEVDPKLARLAGRADRVLVDAPCSGTGTLRRNPDLKWRQSAAEVADMARQQTSILAAASKLVKLGGRLVYATCSLLEAENRLVADAFAAAHPEFTLLPASEVLAAQRTGPEGVGAMLELRPDLHGCDGFFAAVFERTRN